MISIVVPFYNSQSTLDQCLRAISELDSLEEKAEVILVDDGSTDASAQIAKRYPFQLIQLSEKGGVGRARNIGAGQAKGDVLLFVDSGIVLPRETLSAIKQAFQKDRGLAGLSGTISRFSTTPGFLSQFRNLHRHYNSVNKTGKIIYTLLISTFAIRRDIFSSAGGFDERFIRGQDIEFNMRLGKLNVHLQTDPRLEVIALKPYSFFRMLREDYIRFYFMSRLFLDRDREETGRYFKHTVEARTAISLATPGLIIAGFILAFLTPFFLVLSAAGLGLYVYARYGLLHLFFQRGLGFGMAAASTLLLDLFVIKAAVVSAWINSLLKPGEYK